MSDIQEYSMMDFQTQDDFSLTNNNSLNRLVLALSSKDFKEINIVMSHQTGGSRIPKMNPLALHTYIKQKISQSEMITNMRHTRQGKVLFTTSDPICAANLLTLTKLLDIPISATVLWENITTKFLLTDVPTATSLEELVSELACSNDIVITHMRRFVKQNTQPEAAPVLITILGTTLPEHIKMWFIHQKINLFIDRPRMCNKCFSFFHATRTCNLNPACHQCGQIHTSSCQSPMQCINCKGNHSALDKNCPHYIKEIKVLEYKARHHVTTGEARRILNHRTNTNLATIVKSNTCTSDLENTLTTKMEALFQKMQEKIDQQMAAMLTMFEKTFDSLLQKILQMFSSVESQSSSPNRKKVANKSHLVNMNISNLRKTLDKGGTTASA
ncbi:hypothetical protein AVEN_252324-1 [Araneus ventricosus]|uniref:Nucleic-acid-binding protein from transposon X-element n=1 Tax=Araneus ventricosus TaxID=182803 RepID=A0A4Y2AQA5_ARAVE|nr:hypothetical protein AVEN_252324-1 [Araneus ventricosus]